MPSPVPPEASGGERVSGAGLEPAWQWDAPGDATGREPGPGR